MKRVGIDLGGTYIKCGIVDEDHKIICHGAVPTLVEREPEEIIEDMAELVKKLAPNAGISLEDLKGVGIGSPGIINAENGDVIYSNNFGWEKVPLGSILNNKLSLPIKVSNDANCAALGELVCDKNSGYKSAVLLTLGTGVGSGIILDGRLYEGENAGGTELGHMVICHNGRLCSCGRKGCLEAYVSASALVKDAKETASAHPESLLNKLTNNDINAINGKYVIEALRQEDAAVKEIFNKYLEYLGCGITNIVNIFRPDVIYLGGGICEGFDLMETYLNDYIGRNCFGSSIVNAPQIKKASHGNDAGIIGAAALIG